MPSFIIFKLQFVHQSIDAAQMYTFLHFDDIDDFIFGVLEPLLCSQNNFFCTTVSVSFAYSVTSFLKSRLVRYFGMHYMNFKSVINRLTVRSSALHKASDQFPFTSTNDLAQFKIQVLKYDIPRNIGCLPGHRKWFSSVETLLNPVTKSVHVLPEFFFAFKIIPIPNNLVINLFH